MKRLALLNSILGAALLANKRSLASAARKAIATAATQPRRIVKARNAA